MLSDLYFPRINGVSTSIQTFVQSYLALGHSITLIAPEYPYECEPGFGVFRIPAVPLPFDPEDRLMSIRDNGFRRRHGLPEDAFLLLYAGRVAYEKNIEFLMSMFRQVRKAIQRAMLLVAGEGPALAGLRERAKRMGLERHIRFVGHLDRNTELLECYQASEAFVFASPTETQGLVLLEAMASACRSRWASATRSSGASTCRYPRRP